MVEVCCAMAYLVLPERLLSTAGKTGVGRLRLWDLDRGQADCDLVGHTLLHGIHFSSQLLEAMPPLSFLGPLSFAYRCIGPRKGHSRAARTALYSAFVRNQSLFCSKPCTSCIRRRLACSVFASAEVLHAVDVSHWQQNRNRLWRLTGECLLEMSPGCSTDIATVLSSNNLSILLNRRGHLDAATWSLQAEWGPLRHVMPTNPSCTLAQKSRCLGFRTVH